MSVGHAKILGVKKTGQNHALMVKTLLVFGTPIHAAVLFQGYVPQEIPYDSFADAAGSMCVSEADYEGPVQDRQQQIRTGQIVSFARLVWA